MGKIIFWIFVIFAALFLLRLYNVNQLRKKKEAQAEADVKASTAPPGEQMVRCARCGIFLPRSEALLIGGAIRCRERECAAHG
jgi:uncharacterized protein